jgi:hypothetical protein
MKDAPRSTTCKDNQLIAQLERKGCNTSSHATIFLSFFLNFLSSSFLRTRERIDQQLNKESYGLKLNQTR